MKEKDAEFFLGREAMNETHSIWADERQSAIADADDAQRHGQGDPGPKSVPVPSIERARHLVQECLATTETVRREMELHAGFGYIGGYVDRTIVEQRNLQQIAAAIGDGSVRTTHEALANVRLQVVGMKAACKGLKDGAALERAFDRVLGIISHELFEAGECR